MNVAIIGIVGLPARYGGFETLADNLVRNLGRQCNLTVYCSSTQLKEKPASYLNAKLVYLPLSANGIFSPLYDIASMIKAIRNGSDVLLILGVSGCLFLPIIRMFTSAKLVINIDGLEWKRDKWNRLAKAFLKLSEKSAIIYGNTIIVDNPAIQEYVKQEYKKDCELIEYGADHTASQKNIDIAEFIPFPTKGYAVKLCRIEPENNIHIVLEAFLRNSSLPLVVIGNWEKSNYGRQLRKFYSNEGNILLLDPIYDIDILFALRSNAALYIHGHSAGGTNPSLVEAMYIGLPIIAYDVPYNRETTHNKALYFSSVDELEKILKQIGKIDLETIASSMKQLAHTNYVWKRISDMYSAFIC